jgi:cyanate lyase
VLPLQQAPYKGSVPTAVPTDPLIYRFYERVSVYGTTFKELISNRSSRGEIDAATTGALSMRGHPPPAPAAVALHGDSGNGR